MQSQRSNPLTAALTRLAGQDASAPHVAGLIDTLWQAVDAALTPILGAGGVAALFGRAVLDTAVQHPWIAPVTSGQAGLSPSVVLRAAVSRQAPGAAFAAALALLNNFHDLLSSLVGKALTDRLLEPVATTTISDGLLQDPQS